MREIRGHSLTAWIGVVIGVGAFFAVRANGAPLASSSLVLIAHVVGVVWVDDRLTTSTCSVANCEQDAPVSVSDAHAFCPPHAADFYDTAEDATAD